MKWKVTLRNVLFLLLYLPIFSLLCVIKAYQAKTMIELIWHNVAEQQPLISNENVTENVPITIAFTDDIEIERRYFGNRDEWRPYLEEQTLKVKFNLRVDDEPPRPKMPTTNKSHNKCKEKAPPPKKCGCHPGR